MIYDAERKCYTLTKLEENCIKLHIENEALQKKLEIATKALERINDLSSDNDGINDGGIIWCASKALKEMEGVK